MRGFRLSRVAPGCRKKLTAGNAEVRRETDSVCHDHSPKRDGYVLVIFPESRPLLTARRHAHEDEGMAPCTVTFPVQAGKSDDLNSVEFSYGNPPGNAAASGGPGFSSIGTGQP